MTGFDVKLPLRIAPTEVAAVGTRSFAQRPNGAVAPATAKRRGALDNRCRSDEFGKERAGVTDIARGLAALDRSEDRLQ
jgi:hypothetical protein